MNTPFKKVIEATYLSTEKSDKYRAILRFFYIQHERLREFLFPEEIYEHLQRTGIFSNYEMDELHTDMASLVKWGNLQAQQENGKVRTIEEFKKRRFRYQITPYTVEFERMLVQFEQNSDTFGGSLEKTHFERLLQTLKMIQASSSNEPESCAQHWEDLLFYFKKITQNTSDYFAYLRTEDATEQMKSDSFLLYKDQFTLYLRDFIIVLQRTVAGIQDILHMLTRQQIQVFLEKVTRHEDKIFRFESEGHSSDSLEELEATWFNIKSWFLGDDMGESQYENVQRQTNDAIRRMTRIVQRLGERSLLQRSRKDDYLHLAEWFLRLSSNEEAHCLAAVAFGMEHTKHIQSDHIGSDDIYTDVWEESPMAYERMPRVREYREKTKATSIGNHEEQKREAMVEYLEQKAYEKSVIQEYKKDDRIDFAELPIVEPFVRKLFLSWIGKAMARGDRKIKTEYGDKIFVEMDPNRSVTLRSLDGQLTMPAVIFHFSGKEIER